MTPPYLAQAEALARREGYDIVDHLIIVQHDQDWLSLQDRLSRTRQSVYADNQRYIVHHQDTEYFVGDVGLVRENFNRVIASLDIDPCRFIIFINQRHSTKAWLEYCQPNNQYTVIETPFTSLLRHRRPETIAVPEPNVCYHFSCVMGQARSHRDKLAAFLDSQKLVDKNLVVYQRRDLRNNPSDGGKPIGAKRNDLSLLVTQPFARINETWSSRSRHSGSTFMHYNSAVPEFDRDHLLDSSWYVDIFADIAVETVFDYPAASISEKTIRAITGGRPFVLMGAAGTIKWLQDLGFQTFDRWWDESYDAPGDPDQRLDRLFGTITSIASWSRERCCKTLIDMQSVLEHNQARYLEIYQDTWGLPDGVHRPTKTSTINK